MGKRILIVSLAAVAAFPTPDARQSSLLSDQRPNILVIVTDDQRSGLSVMPSTHRWFRSGGRSFPNAEVTTPTCCPSRASIFTGRYAHNHGITYNGGIGRLDQTTTLYSYLHQAGYRTAIYGKYFQPWNLQRPPPFFDDFAITRGRSYYNGSWNVNGRVQDLASYSTTIIRRKTLRFVRSMEASDQQPWFLYVAPTAPHRPFTAERRYSSAPVPRWSGNPAVFEEDKSDKPPRVHAAHKSPRFGRRLRNAQYRTLMSVDDLVGQLAESLRSLGETRRTLAVFISDNGRMWGEHGLSAKDVPYRQAVEVPMMMRWPGRVAPGSTDSRLIANIDIAPTVLRAAGVLPEPSVPMDGRNILGRWDRHHLLLEHWCNTLRACNRWASIRTKGYEYVEYYEDDGRIRFREYYDLRNDPWQLQNLLGDRIESNDPDVARLGETLGRDRACTGSACP